MHPRNPREILGYVRAWGAVGTADGGAHSRVSCRAPYGRASLRACARSTWCRLRVTPLSRLGLFRWSVPVCTHVSSSSRRCAPVPTPSLTADQSARDAFCGTGFFADRLWGAALGACAFLGLQCTFRPTPCAPGFPLHHHVRSVRRHCSPRPLPSLARIVAGPWIEDGSCRIEWQVGLMYTNRDRGSRWSRARERRRDCSPVQVHFSLWPAEIARRTRGGAIRPSCTRRPRTITEHPPDAWATRRWPLPARPGVWPCNRR